MPGPRLLILGGTKEAAKLAHAVVDAFGDQIQVTTSLAGRTRFPKPLPGELRVGGFGGSRGLVDFIKDQGITHLIDATHPFAAVISQNASEACHLTGTPRLMLIRPRWRETKTDRWRRFKDFTSLARELPKLSNRPFLTVGKQGAEHFYTVEGCHFTLRLLAPPNTPLPFESYEIVLGQPPFTLEDEISLLEAHGIDALVTKESGGTATQAKILAARELGVPVFLVERPELPEGERASSLATCLNWLENNSLLQR